MAVTEKTKGKVREERLAKEKPSMVQLTYTRKGSIDLEYGRTTDGAIIPFTQASAERLEKDAKPLRKVSGTIVGRIKLSETKPVINISKQEKALIEALKNHEFCEGSPNSVMQPLFRIIDPEFIEQEKLRVFSDQIEARNLYMTFLSGWQDKGSQFRLLCDAFDLKKSDADLMGYWNEFVDKRPKEFATYVERKADGSVECTERIKTDAILRRAIRAKVVKDAGGGLLVFNEEKLGSDFKSASTSLRDTTPSKGKNHLLTLIQEAIDNAGS